MIPSKHEMLLSKFKEEVCRDQDADFTSSIQTVAAEFRKMETEREQGVINTLFLNLYALDAHSLRRDLSIAIIRIAGKCRAGRPRPAVLPQTARRVVAPYGAPLSAILEPAINWRYLARRKPRPPSAQPCSDVYMECCLCIFKMIFLQSRLCANRSRTLTVWKTAVLNWIHRGSSSLRDVF